METIEPENNDAYEYQDEAEKNKRTPKVMHTA
jgi:hypothetical protein